MITAAAIRAHITEHTARVVDTLTAAAGRTARDEHLVPVADLRPGWDARLDGPHRELSRIVRRLDLDDGIVRVLLAGDRALLLDPQARVFARRPA